MVFDYIYPFEYYVTLVSCNFKALYPNENEYRKSLLPLIEKGLTYIFKKETKKIIILKTCHVTLTSLFFKVLSFKIIW